MKSVNMKIKKIEFEMRIFISFSIVILICALSFSVFAEYPANAVVIGKLAGLSEGTSLSLGFWMAALITAVASILRMWSGSVLTSKRMMAFPVQDDSLLAVGPYLLVRNPIYLADLIAFSGFVLCLPFIGVLLPVLLYLHYTQLIKYEEVSLEKQFKQQYADYQTRVPRLIPDHRSLSSVKAVFKEFEINRDGFRHNAVYLLLVPGFIVASFTHELLHAILIGLPAVIDWAVVHTIIGTAKNPKSNDIQKVEQQRIRSDKKVFEDILYAQCWEDPRIDREAFRTTSDDVVFSITSGGCNALAFLLDNPQKVIALDLNPQQNFLLDLKIAAFRALPYEELLGFFGVKKSRDRFRLYERIRGLLSAESARYWDGQRKKIQRGIIHSGRYEAYMRLLKRIVITPLISKRTLMQFFETEDPAERSVLFHKKWENLRWWFLTRVMLSRKLNTLFFDKAFFAYLDESFSFGKHFAEKAKRAITRLPMKENHFLSYILLGKFYDEDNLPQYLKRENYDVIRSRVDRIEIVTDSCENYFSSLPDSSISRFNFTNIFEWMSDDAYEDLLRETVRVAKDKAVLTYRNLLVFREHPSTLNSNIRSLKKMARALHEKDLSFIYNNYVVEEIQKRDEK
jgi:S-adenosylmethionine-diacylglycerol 3-amino-3-carboxypropyl transferase